MARDPVALAVTGNCTHDRTESYEATAPDGSKGRVLRCLDCGMSVVTPTGDRHEDVGVPMVFGAYDEPVGPEDAIGPGPKRGDYSRRLGGGDYEPHESVPIPDAEPGEPQVQVIEQKGTP